MIWRDLCQGPSLKAMWPPPGPPQARPRVRQRGSLRGVGRGAAQGSLSSCAPRGALQGNKHEITGAKPGTKANVYLEQKKETTNFKKHPKYKRK